MLISSVGVSERKAYLSRVTHDKANGFYDQNLQVGTIPVDIEVARTRSGRFRPAVLPEAYQRHKSSCSQRARCPVVDQGLKCPSYGQALRSVSSSNPAERSHG